MTHNQMITCKFCNTHIRLRITMGYFNIPFNIICPKCGTEIHGEIKLKNMKNDSLFNFPVKIINANLSNDISMSNCYVAELSAEFPTKKLYFHTGEQDLTPYLRSVQIIGEDNYENIQKTLAFSEFIENDWEKMKAQLKLYQNGNFDILKTNLKSYFNIQNELDALMALHQKLITSFGKIFPESTLKEYNLLAEKIIKLYSINKKKLIDYISKLKEDGELYNIEKKELDILNDFCDNYIKFMPALLLKISNRKIDYNQLGISTIGLNDLKAFYTNTYEYILSHLDIIIGLNNIERRGDPYNFINEKVQSFADFSKSKYQKIELLKNNEPFSISIDLNNRIRNSIAHFNLDYDNMTQMLTFIDNYNIKNKVTNIFLIQLAEMCIENLYIIFYINEIVYNLRKIQLINKGYIPSFIKDRHPQKKVGRNEPCPCGSGKKYKKCCMNSNN